MNKSAAKKVIFVMLLLLSVSALNALDLIIYAPPKAVLAMTDGTEVRIDAGGKYIIHDLEPGDVVSFTTEIPGYYPADYAIEMGGLTKTFRLNPEPTGVFAGELKFTDAGFCPGLGIELYFNPEDAYLSFDLYQSFVSLASVFTADADVLSSRYIMPMIGAGFYLIPFDSIIRLNFGLSAGGIFGNGLPHPLFAVEASAGIELKFFDHYILFAEFNPRIISPVRGGWDSFNDIFGTSRSDSVYGIGSWALTGFPSTLFGFKYKY